MNSIKRNNNKYVFIIIALSITLLGVISFCFISKIQAGKQIETLENKISFLEQTIQDNIKVSYDDDSFNYLAIGNSITKHPICEYWWTECGMAATEPSKDYFHLVTKYLDNNNDNVISYPFNFYHWEQMDYDRAETLSVLSPYLDERLNLVTIQLSENVFVLDTFEQDMKTLIGFIKEKAPDARIILIDDFWSDEKGTIKKKVAEDMKISFVNLNEIRNNPEYQCGLGTIVSGEDGQLHKVGHEGVSNHPGDKGMQYIANQIISCIAEVKSLFPLQKDYLKK